MLAFTTHSFGKVSRLPAPIKPEVKFKKQDCQDADKLAQNPSQNQKVQQKGGTVLNTKGQRSVEGVQLPKGLVVPIAKPSEIESRVAPEQVAKIDTSILRKISVVAIGAGIVVIGCGAVASMMFVGPIVSQILTLASIGMMVGGGIMIYKLVQKVGDSVSKATAGLTQAVGVVGTGVSATKDAVTAITTKASDAVSATKGAVTAITTKASDAVSAITTTTGILTDPKPTLRLISGAAVGGLAGALCGNTIAGALLGAAAGGSLGWVSNAAHPSAQNVKSYVGSFLTAAKLVKRVSTWKTVEESCALIKTPTTVELAKKRLLPEVKKAFQQMETSKVKPTKKTKSKVQSILFSETQHVSIKDKFVVAI